MWETMAEKDALLYPGLDKVAGEEFLQEAFQIMLEEGVRKGMDVSEKVRVSKLILSIQTLYSYSYSSWITAKHSTH